MNLIERRKDPSSSNFKGAGRVPVALVLMVMLFGMGFVAVPSVKGSPAELHVGLGQPYATIQSAVDAASPGDTIVVHPGIYIETVDVAKSHITIGSLLGNPSDTIVDAGGADDHVFDITNQTGVTLTGFTIRNAKGTTKGVAGIYVRGSTDCRISNNVVTNIWTTEMWRGVYGISLGNSSRCNLSNNVVTNIISPLGYAYGATLGGSGNKFFNTRIFNVDANSSAYGIIMGGSNNTFSDTYISGIKASTYDALGIPIYGRYNKFANTYISNINGEEAYGMTLGGDGGGSSNEFFNTHISNITSAKYRAYGISTAKYVSRNKFFSTYISNLYAKDNVYGIGLFWFNYYNNFSNTHIFNVTSVSADAFGIRLAAEAKWNNFFNTYIFNINAGQDAYGIDKDDSAIWNNFYNTYISNVNAGRDAYGINYKWWSSTDLFSNANVSNINGRIERLMPWIGLGLISGVVIATVIVIRRRRRKLAPPI